MSRAPTNRAKYLTRRLALSEVTWAYGVTAVASRVDSLMYTLFSLSNAGFSNPRVFIDGDWPSTPETRSINCSYETTFRTPRIGAYANWMLALAELLARNPTATRYALFQDDIAACTNLRAYLDKCVYTDKTYWNLCTYPVNLKRCLEGFTGWYLSNQMGRGAQGLVFNRQAVVDLLNSPEVTSQVFTKGNKRWRNIDGTVCNALKRLGAKDERLAYREYVHNPSLIDHRGSALASTMMSRTQPAILNFPGEQFNALSLLETRVQETREGAMV